VQSAPAITATPGGGIVAAWISDRPTSSGFDVFARRLDAAGAVIGGEIRVSASTMAGSASPPSITTLANGSHLVVWSAEATAGATSVIKGQRLTATGARTGAEFTVSTASFAQSEPMVAATADGGFVVTWTAAGQDGSGRGVYGQRFAATGARAGPTFLVATTTAGDQWEPKPAARADGGFTIAWTSAGQDGSGTGLYARRFGPTGAPLDVEFRLNRTVENDQAQPSLVIRSAEHFLATWTSTGTDGSLEGVYGQRFSIAP
jgi:hypothetical protein